MTYQTNNPSWIDGYSGKQAPANPTPQQLHDHQQGALKRAAEQQAAYENAWKPKKT